MRRDRQALTRIRIAGAGEDAEELIGLDVEPPVGMLGDHRVRLIRPLCVEAFVREAGTAESKPTPVTKATSANLF